MIVSRYRSYDSYDEPPRRKRPICCWDGFCGARDCATCFPYSWDDEDEEEEGTAVTTKLA